MTKKNKGPSKGPQTDTHQDKERENKNITQNFNSLNKAELINVLQQLGYPVLPIPFGLKGPPPTGWTTYTGQYDIDPRGNIAIGTRGELAILITNDDDSTKWATEQFGPPNTKSVRGAHWYFKARGGMLNEANKQTKVGLMEFHVMNKYAVIGPSKHPDGPLYQWVKPLPPVKDLPEAPDLRYLFHAEGTHHAELLAKSSAMALKGLDGEIIFNTLRELVDTQYQDPKGHPDRELREIAESAYKKFHEAPNRKYNMSEDKDATEDLYYPGHIIISTELREKNHFKTISDPTTNLNDIYRFVQVYERAEEFIKTEATAIYLNTWEKMLARCKGFLDALKENNMQSSENIIGYVGKLSGRLKSAIHEGPTVNDINEVLADIRRATYTPKEEMNPPTHVPFLNGLLNLQTQKLEPFNADLFFVWQVQADLLDRHVTLLDAPRFKYYLESVFYEVSIPMILSYGGYSLQPQFPRNKIIIIVGRERIGKGVWARLLNRLNPKGYGTISFEKLLINENRFAFQSILGKNLLVDPEMKRKFRRGFDPDFANINKLFGSDTIDYERKGQDVQDVISQAKGILIGNLPIYAVDNPALIARALIVRTKDARDTVEIPNIDRDIFENEKNEIATLLMQCYFGLQDRKFVFPGEIVNSGGPIEIYDPKTKKMITDGEGLGTLEYWDLLADPVKQFIESETQPADQDVYLPVTNAYTAFDKWCSDQGIPTIAQQTFTSRFQEYTQYAKKNRGGRGNRYYAFQGCELISTLRVNPQNKLNTGVEDQKPKYIGALWNTFKRVQLPSFVSGYYFENKSEIQVINRKKQELNTGYLGGGNLNNTSSPDMKTRVQPFLETQDFKQGEGSYFKIMGDCSIYRKGESRILKVGVTVFLYHNEAARLVQEGLITLACPNGTWDPVSKDCISDTGNREQGGPENDRTE